MALRNAKFPKNTIRIVKLGLTGYEHIRFKRNNTSNFQHYFVKKKEDLCKLLICVNLPRISKICQHSS